MKLATTTGDFGAYGLSQEESVRYIRKAGFRCADYNFVSDFAAKSGFFSDNWRTYGARMNAVAGEIGVEWVQAHSPMGRPLICDEAHADFIAGTKRCIEACALLGIPNLVVHSGYVQGISKEECFERNRAFYLDLLTVAETCGVNILVENFNRMCVDGMYWIDNAPDLRAMVDYVDHPLFHACWDVGHANMQEMPQSDALRIVGEHVYALHVQDNFGNDDSHMAPFCGTTNMDDLMHGLLDIGYRGYFTFESGNIFRPARARRQYEADTRLAQAPLGLRLKAEELIYEIGRYTLEAYGCFEE